MQNFTKSSRNQFKFKIKKKTVWWKMIKIPTCKIRKYKVQINPRAYFTKYSELKCPKWYIIERKYAGQRPHIICHYLHYYLVIFNSSDKSPKFWNRDLRWIENILYSLQFFQDFFFSQPNFLRFQICNNEGLKIGHVQPKLFYKTFTRVLKKEKWLSSVQKAAVL